MCSIFLMSFYYGVVYTLTLFILSSDLTSPTDASWSFHTKFCGNIWKLTNSIWESYPRDLTGLVRWNLWLIRLQHKSPLRYILIGLCTTHLPQKISALLLFFTCTVRKPMVSHLCWILNCFLHYLKQIQWWNYLASIISTVCSIIRV